MREEVVNQTPFGIDHHSIMLADEIRNDAYRKAIQSVVRPSDCVVDLGSGTGLLSQYIEECSPRSIHSIEYFVETVELWKQFSQMRSSPSQAQIHTKRSYDVYLEDQPSVLVTETFGQLALEEGTVESCYDFVRRHPTIDRVVPSSFGLFACEGHSHSVESKFESLAQAFESSHKVELSETTLHRLAYAFGSMMRCGDLSDMTSCAPRTNLASYELGVASDSSFSSSFHVQNTASNVVHLYFEALLTEEVSMSTAYDQPSTHWTHVYVFRPPHCQNLNIQYSRELRDFLFSWG